MDGRQLVMVLTILSLFYRGAAAQIGGTGPASPTRTPDPATPAATEAPPPPPGWVRERVGLLVLEGPPEAARAVHALAAQASGILPQVETALDQRPARVYRMILVPALGLPDSSLARMDESAPEWAAGYMIPERRIGAIRIARAAQYPYGTLESVLAHESAHLLLYDAAHGRLPLWFDEGVATWEGRRWTPEDAWIYARGLLTSDLPRLADLDTLFHATAAEAELAYAASFAFVSWNVHRRGADFVPRLLHEARARPFTAAWQAVAGEPLDRAEEQWRRDSLIRYRWVPLVTASSTLWALLALLAAWAGMLRRARARAFRERWRDAEDATETDTEDA